MTRLISIFTLLLIALSSCSKSTQEITGKWSGALNVQGMQLRLVLNIENRKQATNLPWIVLTKGLMA